MIVFEFEKFPGSFYYQVPESELPRYNRVLQAYEGNVEEAQERLRLTFNNDAIVKYEEWKTFCGLN